MEGPEAGEDQPRLYFVCASSQGSSATSSRSFHSSTVGLPWSHISWAFASASAWSAASIQSPQTILPAGLRT